MTYADREEAYKAGRENRVIHTAHPDAYDEGQRDRKRARDRARDTDRGGGAGLVAIVLLAVVGVIIALVVASALGAIAAALVVMIAARVPPAASQQSYREAYKTSFYALATWLVVTGAIGFGAIGMENGQPGGWYEFVRQTARAFAELGRYAVAVPISWLQWPAEMSPPTPVPPLDLHTASLLSLGIPAWIGVVVALKIHTEFGLLRAAVTAPLVVAAGAGMALASLLGVAALAVRADTPPLEFGSELALVAALATAATAVTALLSAVVVGGLSWAVTLGRRFSLGAGTRAAAAAVFASCFLTAVAIFLFRHGDGLVEAVRATIQSRQWTMLPVAALVAFLPLAAPGVLIGALLLRRAAPLPGLPGYLVACLAFAPFALVCNIVALGVGFAAFESAYFTQLLS